MAKKKASSGGGDEWLVTYGDTITLMLCFFILMFAFTVEDAAKAKKVTASLQKTFGKAAPAAPKASGSQIADLIQRLQEKMVDGGPLTEAGNVSITVHAVREGIVVRLGGDLFFEQGSAKLLPIAIPVVEQLANLIKGTPNTVEIRGHTSGEADDALAGAAALAKWDLSWERAHAVLEYLVAHGEKEERFRVVGCSRFEPIAQNFTESQQQELNRRVELIVHPLGD